MAAAGDAELTLLTKLQSGDLHHIHRLISSHLFPFQTLIKPPQNPNPKSTKNPSPSLIRSLAKSHLSFLNRSLSLIPKRLSETTPKIDPQFTPELFESYKLCLQCLECISSQLSCKPYSVHLQRARMIHCMEAWEKYGEAEAEGWSVLEGLRGIYSGGKRNFKFVPGVEKEGGGDRELAFLVVEIVVTVLKCVCMKTSRGEGDYRNMLVLVEEVAPWFRVLDASAYEKLHRALVTYLNKCSILLVGELNSVNKDIVRGLLLATFAEYQRSAMKDQLHKFASRICSSLYLLPENQSSSIMDILSCILDFIAIECKVENESKTNDFLELVGYCAHKCRITRRHLCSALAAHIKKLAGDLSKVDKILRLYSTGLFLMDSSVQPGQDSTTKRNLSCGSLVEFLLDKNDVLHDFSVLLGNIKFPSSASKTNSLLTTDECNISVDFLCQMKNAKLFLLPLYDALKFICQPLAESVNSARNVIFAQVDDACPLTVLRTIGDAFLLFSDVFWVCRSTLEEESVGYDDYNRPLLGIAVAALTLSFRTSYHAKESFLFIKQVIAADWVQINALKFLCASIYNIGVTLYKSNQVKEASKALKLCCIASWACVSHVCKIFIKQSYKFSGDLSHDDFANFVNEACAKSAFLLDLLYQCNSLDKATKVIRESLENWSAAENILQTVPSPLPLVKQWVKLECKRCKDSDLEGGAVSLYTLLSSSTSVSRRSLGVILEQELLSYSGVSAQNPKLCHKMQIDIADVLLADVYITEDRCLQRLKILVMKGRELRAFGFEGLNACIECLSEAISLFTGVNDEKDSQPVAASHHLGVAYALRALCVQEAEPNSKKPIDDIDVALKLWLSPKCWADDRWDMAVENMLIILYHAIDMLSLKGCTKFHSSIYKLLIKLFANKNIPSEKCLALLWQGRRLSHGLCASPLNEAFVATLNQQCVEPSRSIEFWQNCLSKSLPLEMGFWQCFSFMFTSIFPAVSCFGRTCRLTIEADNVKQAATDLLSSVPFSSGSAFLAAHLYYDLCDRMISKGLLTKALLCAKEAYRLRSKLLQEKFRYSVNQQAEICDETGEIVKKRRYNLSSFQMRNTVATMAWFGDQTLFDLDGTVLTPWNVLQCYLESTLQVGIVHELMGSGSEAEALLLWGKSISSFQGLPLFELVYSSVLGKVYRKQQLWDQAEEELQSAQLILKNSYCISCSKCRSLLEATIILEFADLSRSRRDNYTENLSVKRLCDAETLYKLAMDKLNCSEWKNSVSNSEDSSDRNGFAHDAPNKKVGHQADVPDAKKPTTRSRKTKNPLVQGQRLITEQNVRMTRSKFRRQTNKEIVPSEMGQVGLTDQSSSEQPLALPDTLEQIVPALENSSSTTDFQIEMSCFCSKKSCWYCLAVEVIQSGSLNNIVLMKWEFARRQLSLKVLGGLGKCLDSCGKTHESHEQMVQSISVLVSKNSFSAHSSVQLSFLLDLIGKDIPGDAFAIPRAALLYNICWFALKSYPCKLPRIICCDMANIQIIRVTSWLMLALVLCREVPVLVQKVSRLLAVIFVLSASTELFPQPVSSCKTLGESHWASFFHQASIGTYVNQQIVSSIETEKLWESLVVEDACLPNSSLKLLPESLQDLEGHAQRFFDGVPCATIIGMSLLGGSFASLLSKLLESQFAAPAWLLLSRLNSNHQPVVILRPVDSILEEASDDDTTPGSGILFEDKSVKKRWRCPWGFTVVDDIAPVFKQILEKSYLSSSVRPLEDTKQNRLLWWKQRKSLDQQLGNFMRDLEDSWLGSWKYLLLGEWSGCHEQESVLRKLMHDLRSKIEVDIPLGLLKVILGGAKLACLREECILQLILNKGCLITRMNNKENYEILADRCEGTGSLSQRVMKLIFDAMVETEEEGLSREPVILVLDNDVQMLPWESLPVLRNQEVYRMPSIGSIFATLECYQCREVLGTNPVAFPKIDPLDAFYVLNPSGDLSNTQAEFENWFRDHNLEGKAGSSPTVDELVVALRSHDLYIYFGHGSGAQYIPGHEIQKLEHCAATLLMGCSSGSLSLNGRYAPQGAPLSYLLAGSPVIVANLWDVTDKDIDRFGKAMLDCWLRERSSPSVDCLHCKSLVVENFKSIQITGTKGNTKKKTSRKNMSKNCDLGTPNACNHRPKVGCFMGQAREACTLPYLIGASPVCYGVPTLICKKKEL